MKTVLVTGGAGYIGSHAARVLMTEGYEVVILDDLSTGDKRLVPQGTKFVKGSAGDESLVTALIRSRGIKDVMHFAAFTDVAESELRPDKYFENNYDNTKRLVAACRAAGVKRFVFSSTAAVYGNPDVIPVPENAPLYPISVYGKSKVLAEKVVAESGMQYVILRYFNVAGGGYAGTSHTHLTRRAVQAALGELEQFEVFGTDYPTDDGTPVRDLIHVKDLVGAHVAVLEHLRDGGASDIFNVGYGKGYSVLEVINTAKEITGSNVPVVFGGRREADIMTMVADNRKLIRATGWQPEHTSLDEILRDEVAWVQSQKVPQK